MILVNSKADLFFVLVEVPRVLPQYHMSSFHPTSDQCYVKSLYEITVLNTLLPPVSVRGICALNWKHPERNITHVDSESVQYFMLSIVLSLYNACVILTHELPKEIKRKW